MRSAYLTPGVMTSPGKHQPQLSALPREVPELIATVQGWLLHEHAAHHYGVTFTEQDQRSVHLRPAEQLLDHVLATDPRPLREPRPPQYRIAANCRHFTVLLVTLLRLRGIPARARCGFANYFTRGFHEDHWVCEYWTGTRWALADAQIDQRQRELLGITLNTVDVPRTAFLVAGDAWTRCHDGLARPDRFGLSLTGQSGLWWIAGNLMRDAAALTGVEVLPWDVWGAMPGPEGEITEPDRTLFDTLARLTSAPDARPGELELLCATDDRLRLGATVHNALRNQDEPL